MFVRIYLLIWRCQAFLREKYKTVFGRGVFKSVKTMLMNINICSLSWIVTGVCQLVNKMEETTGKVKPFNRNDEQFLEAFVIFCGLGIQNTQMYEAVERAMAKQMVTLEVSQYLRDFSASMAIHSAYTFLCNSSWCLLLSLQEVCNLDDQTLISSFKQLRKLRPRIF